MSARATRSAATAVRQPRPPESDESASDTRRSVLQQVQSTPKVWTARDLAERLGLEKSTVAYHLRALVETQRVKVEGKSRATRYLPA